MIISKETNGFSNENEALEGGLRGGYYGGYFEHHVIRDMSYGLWTDARHYSASMPNVQKNYHEISQKIGVEVTSFIRDLI